MQGAVCAPLRSYLNKRFNPCGFSFWFSNSFHLKRAPQKKWGRLGAVIFLENPRRGWVWGFPGGVGRGVSQEGLGGGSPRRGWEGGLPGGAAG